MGENFAELFEQSLAAQQMRPGEILKGTVVQIRGDFVIVNAGLKTEGTIPITQFYDDLGELEVAVGDEVEVALDSVEDGFGETRLSREKAKRAQCWTELADAHEKDLPVSGVISGKVKGGFTVDLSTIRAFLPGSLVDVRPVRDPSHLEGKVFEFKVIKLDKKRNNVVVSRRSVVESESNAEREELLANLQEGQSVAGIVKNLTDYGAFVDLGGIDGLLHITDMSWKRVKHPSEIVTVGDEVNVKVLKFDRERSRVSLGLKQLSDDPWAKIADRYPENTRLNGRVTNITDYGCFVEIEDGVEGLVHVSEMDWTNKNIHPSKVVQLEQEVEVMILEVDEERRRISLGIKQCMGNPWKSFADTHDKGDKVVAKIKSITDFGIFIGLDGGIDGLVHLSDISWHQAGEEAIRDYKKGQEVEATVLAVDAERERISLGIKQIVEDPFSNFLSEYSKGSILKGVVTEVEAKLVTLDLSDGVIGHLRVQEISREERIEDARNHIKVGEEVEAKFMSLDRKTRVVNLSIKAKENQEEAKAIKDYQRKPDSGVSTTLGELLKEKMNSQQKDEGEGEDDGST